MNLRSRERPRRRVITAVALVAGLLLESLWAGCATRPPVQPVPPPAVSEAPPARQTFEATAYSVKGVTASQRKTRRGIVAADPAVLPLGTRIRVFEAGSYSGTYLVADTGRAIKGRKIDIFMPNDAEARRFGRRTVRVQLVDAQGQPSDTTAP